MVHAELRRIARRHMGHERDGHTLQPTALVNEAYLKLIDIRHVQWQDRGHFFAMSSHFMRRILVLAKPFVRQTWAKEISPEGAAVEPTERDPRH